MRNYFVIFNDGSLPSSNVYGSLVPIVIWIDNTDGTWESSYKEVLELRSKYTVRNYNNVGNYYAHIIDFEKALLQIEKTHDIHKMLLGEEHNFIPKSKSRLEVYKNNRIE